MLYDIGPDHERRPDDREAILVDKDRARRGEEPRAAPDIVVAGIPNYCPPANRGPHVEMPVMRNACGRQPS